MDEEYKGIAAIILVVVAGLCGVIATASLLVQREQRARFDAIAECSKATGKPAECSQAMK